MFTGKLLKAIGTILISIICISITGCNKPTPERTCVINFQDTVKGYNKLVLSPYKGGLVYFIKDSTQIREPVPLNQIEYLEEK